MLAMVFTCKKFRLYILESHVIVHTESDNVIADHLSRLERLTKDERRTEIEENFPNELLFQVSIQVPWYADIVNYLAYRIMPLEFSYQQKIKLMTDARFYIWDDPLLFRKGAYQIIRRCVS